MTLEILEGRAVWPGTAEVTPSLSLLPLSALLSLSWDSLSVVPGCYHSNTVCLNCEQDFSLLLATPTTVKMLLFLIYPDKLVLNMSICLYPEVWPFLNEKIASKIPLDV